MWWTRALPALDLPECPSLTEGIYCSRRPPYSFLTWHLFKGKMAFWSAGKRAVRGAVSEGVAVPGCGLRRSGRLACVVRGSGSWLHRGRHAVHTAAPKPTSAWALFLTTPAPGFVFS